ncbi:hypothetical protein G6F62_001803 [Rhizopus arrhizus]|uniref:HAM1-like N-terminal domain-containing protein n=1 Tax=Rhizopus oryzae TaxID=64495 RepID=A0A9P6XCJ0_RHIOR|nr:hypothetical protein G6F23_006551 [Rhizopus arrhizus]KAG0916766.1 hypothetical protein G6F33_002107 [Rhizopus arrhizus]KAG0951495.1 hypothetical protein G6F32_004841 [Rhizopus arrhizus]KAG1292438.1 hypothetical protein G6F66_006967 [Rhizopus arrhizus]KAG1310430.1 hypothetical protein G6F64_004562 [Rhizopus arrhizus]
MATIFLTTNSNYYYDCPQRVPLTEDHIQPTVRRLSAQYERRRSEEHLKSLAFEEKAAVTEMLSLLRQGRLPNNQQISTIISNILSSRVIESQPVSKDGQLILKEIQDLLIIIQKALILKNSDELFQSMMYHIKRVTDLQKNEEFTLGTLDLLKAILFFLFDDSFINLLNQILLTVQTIFTKDKPNGNHESIVLAPQIRLSNYTCQKTKMHDVKPSAPHSDINVDIMACLQNIFTTFKEHPQYHSSFKSLFQILIIWTHSVSREVSFPDNLNEHLELVVQETKEVFERWTGGLLLDPLLKESSSLAHLIRKDPQLTDLYIKIRSLVIQSFQDFDLSSWSQLVMELKEPKADPCRQTITHLVERAQGLLEAFKNDEIFKEISKKVYSIHQHLWNDKTILKHHLLDDFKMTLLPALIEQIKYVPLPRLVIQENEQYEMVIDNMVIPGDTLMPEAIELKVDDYLRFCPKSSSGSTSVQGLFLHLHGIQTLLEDANFWYKRKTGLLDITDSGIVSVHIDGLSLSIRLVSDSKDVLHRFQVENCVCEINKLEVQVKKSRYK